MMDNIAASKIAEFLNSDLIGLDFLIHSVSSLSNLKPNSLIFTNQSLILKNDKKLFFLITEKDFKKSEINPNFSYVIVSNPRLAFAKVIKKFFIKTKKPFIHPSAIVEKGAKVHSSVSIGAYSYIESGVAINEGTVVKNNVTISGDVKIGKFCYIKSGAVIGEEGFGFDFEEDKTPFRISHLGGIEIGDYVEIGSNSIVARGSINNTTIDNNTKIDDLVLIAHNSIIGKSNIITGCADISGSVEIGSNCWIGPNSVLQEKVKIGSNCFIGMGSIVRRNLLNNESILPIESFDILTHLKVRQGLGVDRRGRYKKNK